MPTLNKHDIRTVRASLPSTYAALVQHMVEQGWSATLVYPTEVEPHGFIGFAKPERWHDRATLACRCQYGYRVEAPVTPAQMLATARRAAELCLRVYETFVDVIPGTPNIHGDITPDPIINVPRYQQETYEQWQTRLGCPALRVLTGWNDVLNFCWQRRDYRLSRAACERLLARADMQLKPLRGEQLY